MPQSMNLSELFSRVCESDEAQMLQHLSRGARRAMAETYAGRVALAVSEAVSDHGILNPAAAGPSRTAAIAAAFRAIAAMAVLAEVTPEEVTAALAADG